MTKAAKDPAAELEILFPDVEITVRDPDTGHPVDLTVREFRFLEGLEARSIARPIIEALADVVGSSTDLEFALVDAALAENAEAWIALVSRACGMKPEWIARMRDVDGDALAEAMWSANRDFLLRRVVTEVAARREKANRSGSGSSSTPSSGPGTGAGTKT